MWLPLLLVALANFFLSRAEFSMQVHQNRCFSSAIKPFRTFEANCACRCRYHCIKDSRCLSFSAEGKVQGDGFRCLLADQLLPLIDASIPMPNAVYGALNASMLTYDYNLAMVYVGPDGKKYWIPPQTAGIVEARNICANVGYQLSVVKTIAVFEFMEKICLEKQIQLRVDLTKKKGQPIWPDGTFAMDTELGQDMDRYILNNGGDTQVFRMKPNGANAIMDDNAPDNAFNIWCQET